jgi:hypothetical protein
VEKKDDRIPQLKFDKTQVVIVALEAAKANIKNSATIEEAVKKVDQLLLIANTTEKVEKETKPESVETVNVTLTVPLPVAFHKILQNLSEITGLSVETMLTDDLFQILTGYFNGGYLDSWLEWVGSNMIDKAESLEKEMEKIRTTLF